MDQRLRVVQRQACLQLVEQHGKAVVALLQQAAEGRRVAEAAIHQAFVKGFELMGEITDGGDLGHARTTLEGVQVTLQRQQRAMVVGFAQPTVEGLPGAFQDIHRLFEEDGDHFLVEGFIDAGRVGRRGLDHRLRLDGRRGQVLLQAGSGQLGQGHLVELLGLFHQLRQGRQLGVGGVPVDQAFQVRLIEFLDGQPGGQLGIEQRQGSGVDRFLQQLAQGLHALGLGRDLKGRSHLVHHADQRFVGTLGFGEEALADGEAAFFHGTVGVEQGFAELFDLRQLGHLGTAAEGVQFFQQGSQFLALGRVLAPAAQQVFGIQQDVHAFSEEYGDQLRVAYRLAPLTQARGFGGAETILMQLLHTLEELGGAGDPRQRRGFQLLQPGAEQVFGVAQQLGLGQVHLHQVGLVFLGQLFQGRGDLGDRQDARHVRTALEGVQGTLEAVGDRLRQGLGAVGEEAHQAVEVRLGLIAEDLQQLRVERLFVAFGNARGFRHGRCFRLALGLDCLC